MSREIRNHFPSPSLNPTNSIIFIYFTHPLILILPVADVFARCVASPIASLNGSLSCVAFVPQSTLVAGLNEDVRSLLYLILFILTKEADGVNVGDVAVSVGAE